MRTPLVICALMILAGLALLVSGCAQPPGRQNPGAAVAYIIATDAEMREATRRLPIGPPGWLYMGVCFRDRIVERFAGSAPWVFPHEVGHAADRLGSYRAAIDALTPPDPTPWMAKRLALLREIDAAGPDYWSTIYRRFGREAIGGHTDILARIER